MFLGGIGLELGLGCLHTWVPGMVVNVLGRLFVVERKQQQSQNLSGG